MKIRYLTTVIICLSLTGSIGQSKEFFVSPNGSDIHGGTDLKPFATIERARNAVRKYLKSGGKDRRIIVNISQGIYRLEETLVFGLKDSAPDGVEIVYKAKEDENVVITSGAKITDWKKLNNYPETLAKEARGHVWVADMPETRKGKWNFRTLYDGEEMLSRARSKGFAPTNDCPSPAHGHRWSDLNTLRFPPGTLRNWDNLDDVEIVIRPSHQWLLNILPLASVNEEKGIAKTSVNGTYMLARVTRQNWTETCWVENVLEALDEPGEWVLNTKEGRLYYWPVSGEPGENIQAPRLRELVRVEGKNVDDINGDIPVRGITFQRLIFTGGDRDVWTPKDKGIQHDWDMFDKNNAMLRFRGAKDCLVSQCEFRNAGSSGVRVDLYGQNIRIENSKFYNLGGTGVLLCGYGPGLKDVNKGNTVYNNEFHHIGQIWLHSPAVFIWQSGENRVLNNYIHHLPYDAIVLSGVRPRYFGIFDPVKWKGYIIPRSIRENMQVIRWHEIGNPQTADEALRFSHARKNLVQDNEIHNIMEVLGDGNAIYLSCAGKENIIRRNLIYNSTRANNEIRFDDDQEESHVVENIIFGNGIKLKHANYIKNNIIVGGGISIRPETAIGAKIQRNIIFSTNDPPSFYNTNVTNVKMSSLLDLARPDYNLFYSLDSKGGREAFRFIQATGHDTHSVFADPGFVDMKNGDLRLKHDSPSLKLGIASIEIEKIGLKEDPAFKRLRRQGFNFLYVPIPEYELK